MIPGERVRLIICINKSKEKHKPVENLHIKISNWSLVPRLSKGIFKGNGGNHV